MIPPADEKSPANNFSFNNDQYKDLYSQPIPLAGNRIAILQYPKGTMQKNEIESIRMMLNLIALNEGIEIKKPSDVDGS